MTLVPLNLALQYADYLAVGIFGLSGALAAAHKKHDIVTFVFFAAITGVGGGSVRDLLIGAPVFWIQNPGYILACLISAALVWFLWRPDWRFRAVLWFDALGMAGYSVLGAAKSLSLGIHPASAIVMGVLTAAFGRILRDLLAEEPNLLLRREIYITAALAGAVAFVLLRLLQIDFWASAMIGFTFAFVLRAGAIYYGWRLPAFAGKHSKE